MFCKRGIFINWGNIPYTEIDFGPVNLFSGGNGSGKTTVADGIQSLMTAAHENLFTYNPGQDETTQRGRGGKQVRTLASYVLGCDDGSYSRPQTTDGYVAAVFHPTQGEKGAPFTAVMCVRATLDNAGAIRQARQLVLQFLLLPEQALSLSDFVFDRQGQEHVVSVNKITAHLQKRLGEDRIEVFDKKGPYLRRLYAAFKGGAAALSDREAKHAARTFSNFMAYKPVKSIHDFVSREVLEPKDLSDDIKQVSELMKTIHGMEQETRYLTTAIANLDQALQLSQSFIDDWINLSIDDYHESLLNYNLKQQDYLAAKERQQSLVEKIRQTESLRLVSDNKKQQLHDELISLEARRQGIDALRSKDQLQQQIEKLNSHLVQITQPLLEQYQQYKINADQAKVLDSVLDKKSQCIDLASIQAQPLGKALAAVLALPADTCINVHNLLTCDWVDITDVESKLEQLITHEGIQNSLVNKLHGNAPQQNSIRDDLIATMHRKKDQLERLATQSQSRQQELQRLKHKTINYPSHVDMALKAISQQCPAARPFVLCDFIEVTDKAWQMAIEGYLGGNRFAIIVEASAEAEAIGIIRSLKGRQNQARIIQSQKVQADASRLALSDDSMVHLMTFSHKTAEHYLKASYGNVCCVDTEERLRITPRGIMAQGIGSGGYSMFRCDLDDTELVFGQFARDKALRAKKLQWQSLQQELQQYRQELADLDDLYQCINGIQPLHLCRHIETILLTYRQIQKAENQLKQLDVNAYSAIDGELNTLKTTYKSAEEKGKALTETLGQLKAEVNQIERLLSKISDEKERLQDIRDNKAQIALTCSEHYPDTDINVALKKKQAETDKSIKDLVTGQQQRLLRLDKWQRELNDCLLRHNQSASAYHTLNVDMAMAEQRSERYFINIVQVQKDVQRIFHALKNNLLIDKHDKILSLKDSFNTAFVTNLCHSIYQAISTGKRTLENLNKELAHHRFGADKERFYFAYDWVPEFREYYRFFDEVIKIPNLGDDNSLFDIVLSDKSAAVRDKLLTMLLERDEQSAITELNRISDYRNYRHYEIYKEPLNKEPIALSTYGTGSGGQLETPAYIIRSAAVTSAFRFSEGDTHCRMVLVDEAFSKMDETRSREVISYLTETLGLQLIFIMPTSKSGPFMDLISHQVVFSKCPASSPIGELNTVVLVDRKTCNQDKIVELWANHRKTIRQQSMLDFMEEFG